MSSSSNRQQTQKAPAIDYKRLVEEMKRQGVFQKETRVEVGLMTKFGIALGGFAASTAYIADGIPVIGHVIRGVDDVCKGASVGYSVKMTQLKAEEERKIAEAKKTLALQPA